MTKNNQSNFKVLRYVKDRLDEFNLNFWLEGGTALSAYRDRIIFKWEHDIDLAIWFKDLDKLLLAIEAFKKDGCKIRIQRNFLYSPTPFIDNLIQIYIPQEITGENPQINQIDFYMYHQKGDYAYMRWFNSPSGILGPIFKKIFFRFRTLLLDGKDSKGIIKYVNFLISSNIRRNVFTLFFNLYYQIGKCIYHIHPIHFFKELKIINLYGIDFNIAKETEDYLAHRYGKNWKIPDSSFNNNFYKKKWKKIGARQEFRFNILKKPKLDFSIPFNNKKYLPDFE